jgi:glycosyltransferase involved in cell wall biosynthesis
MKRLLLISYAFPPEPLPGALRPAYITRYLSEFGWDTTVLTHSAGDPPFPARVERAGARAIASQNPPNGAAARRSSALRSWLGHIRRTLLFPDEMAAWIVPAIVAGARIMRRERFDAILTTALPTSVHVAGACLSRVFGTPWLADYRDLWSGNPHMPWGPVKCALERSAEHFIVKRASMITTISQPLADYLEQLHHREVCVIPNAYDAAEWAAIEEQQPAGFDLVYTGALYGKRDPDLLFRALAELRDEGDAVASSARVHFYGHHNEQADIRARQYGLERQVEIHGVVPRNDAMRAQRAAALLLVFLSMDPVTATETGSKYLEYVGAQRPMLVIGPPQSVMRQKMDELGIGWFASDVSEAKAALRKAFARFTEGNYTAHADPDAVVTAKDLAREFGRCLERMQPNAYGRAPYVTRPSAAGASPLPRTGPGDTIQ